MSYGHSTELHDFDQNGNAKQSARGGGNIATFYMEDRLGDGGQIVQREMVLIRAPGDKLSEAVSKVTDEIRKDYPREYEAFKRGLTLEAEGTPIQAWTDIGISARRELMLLGFNTLEQLAGASDAQCGGATNGMVLRRKAQIHLAKNKPAPVDEVAALKDQVAQLTKLVEGQNVLRESKPGDDQPKRRGRPPRAAGDKTGSSAPSGGMDRVLAEQAAGEPA